jgi:cytochrome b subunit of formate dehydrogenase
MSEQRRYLRFPLRYRIEHWILFLTFTTLAVTGLVQKFSLVGISQWIVSLLGGIETTRVIHHVAAVLFILEVVYHAGIVGYQLIVLRSRASMMPNLDDFRNAWQLVSFNFGFAKQRPAESRYTFAEKMEYWAVIWGTLIMAITGFMMLNPIATTKVLPGVFIPAAKAAHGGEALLAVLAIIVWHLYYVHIRSFNKSMFTGYLSEEEMREEHAAELADIQAHGEVKPQLENVPGARSRQRIYLPMFGVIAIAAMAGLYYFATFEQTAITTIPPAEDVVIYSPLTATPFPTALPTDTPSAQQPTTWDDGIGEIFQARCGSCHGGTSSMGGLSLGTYANAMKGGASGAVIVPDQPDSSELVRLQAAGGHPGQLSGDELQYIREWISNGAPEK